MSAAPDGAVATVGSFDGLHRGHWSVLEKTGERARALGVPALLVTFEPHPLEVVNPEVAPRLLTSLAERLELLAQSPIDRVAVLPFTPELARLAPEAFVTEILLSRFAIRALVTGHDHGFGRRRKGNVDLLVRLGREHGFGVHRVDPMQVRGRPVSSARIRDAVASGDLEGAAAGLGRRYSAIGRVARGAGRGRGLGVPTINVHLPDPRKLLPPDGVYAGWVEWRGGRHQAMMNVGPRPTFGEHARVLEAHLFEFNGDLYDAPVKIEWATRLRAVRAFDDPAALAAQLASDARAARRALTATPTSD
jgi:riboflavin kinase/FMN adenylyltransferase